MKNPCQAGSTYVQAWRPLLRKSGFWKRGDYADLRPRGSRFDGHLTIVLA